MTYNLPVYYEVKGYIKVEANSLDEAIKIAQRDINNFPLPEDTSYVEDSFELEEEEIIRENYSE
jgi:hypothetical protein